MAKLSPDGRYLIQQNDGQVAIFDQYTDEVLLTFNPYDKNATAIAQKQIYDLEQLDDEQKVFAHFWSGYFYAHATGNVHD
jgi:hypothetical protein